LAVVVSAVVQAVLPLAEAVVAVVPAALAAMQADADKY
jgi:hypothetical protein